MISNDIIQALPLPAFVVGPGDIIEHANAPARSLFEHLTEGQIFAAILRQPEALACLKSAKETGIAQSCELVIKYPISRTFTGHAAPIGEYVLFSLVDISAELDAEISRSNFVANVSHELRSPLAAISGVIETLQGPARNDEPSRDRFLTLMKGETERMSRLVGDLLSLSKLEAKEHLRPEGEVNLQAVINQVITVLSKSHPDYQDRVQFSHSHEDVKIIGDADELTEVFQNIIENALKYSPQDTQVDVSIEVIPTQMDQNPQVEVRVKDRGDGIAKEHLPRITERFYRVDKGRSREMGGTGLGLAISKHILNRHRAFLSFESELGEGTNVVVTFKNSL